MLKKLLAIGLVATLLITPLNAEAKIKTVTKETYEVTYYDVTHHKGIQFIEKAVGVAIKKRKGSNVYDGIVLNSGNTKYNYIAYNKTTKGKQIKRGDIVVTYLYYNPKNNAEDDVIKRTDKVIGHMTNKDLKGIGK